MKLQITTKKKELEEKVRVLELAFGGLRNKIGLLEDKGSCPACGHKDG